LDAGGFSRGAVGATDGPYSGVKKVVSNNLVPAIGSFFEVPGKNRVRLQERVEGNRHCVSIEWPTQV
jgi:hypothetical protein